MKIEVGESLGYSYLRHVKQCWLVQVNWKASEHWAKHMTDAELTCPPRTGPGVMLVLGLKERGVKMARRKHTAEQIINKLREAEVAISAGSTVAEVSRQIGVTQQTFYRWRTEYGGLKIDQARRLKQLETENGRLRRAVADLTLDNQILREAAEGNF